MAKEFLKQQIVSRISSIIPTSTLGKLTRTTLIIPYYHIVSDDHHPHVNHLYHYKNTKQFKNDVNFLLKNYSPISLFDLLENLKKGRPLPERAFLLTFDDGFREINDIVAPILLEQGVPATFFINTAFLDNQTLCYQHKASILIDHFQKMESFNLEGKTKEILLKYEVDFSDITSSILSITYQQREFLDQMAHLIDLDFNDYLLKNKPYLTSDQIKSLIRDGFTIGAHSIDHPLYSSLALKDQLHQTIESVKQVRKKFRLNYSAFAFPHSDNSISKKFFLELSKSGLVDVSFGTSGLGKDTIPYHLQRFSMEKPLLPANRIIGLQYARQLFRSVSGNGIITRQ